jgi:predicted Rdx family selenoprotein
LAEEIKKEFGYDVDLIAGSGGVFDIKADGILVFSKFKSGNDFPQKGEVIQLLKENSS